MQNFIGTDEYHQHKKKRFRSGDEIDLAKNPAFLIPDISVRKLYSDEFQRKSAIYFGEQPIFDEILSKIKESIEKL